MISPVLLSLIKYDNLKIIYLDLVSHNLLLFYFDFNLVLDLERVKVIKLS